MSVVNKTIGKDYEADDLLSWHAFIVKYGIRMNIFLSVVVEVDRLHIFFDLFDVKCKKCNVLWI